MAIENLGNYDIYADDPRSNAKSPEDSSYEYWNNERDSKPSDLTLIGTSTTNPARPRTVAAGYDKERQILTVVFRDGRWWNYYDVPEYMWQEFVASESKGKYLRESGLDVWDDMGPANSEALSPRRRAKLNKMAADAERRQRESGGLQSEKLGRFAQFKNTVFSIVNSIIGRNR